MKTYLVPIGSDALHSPEAALDCFLWEQNGYAPRTTARLALDDEKLSLRMTCTEKEPLARFTEDGSPVHLDSCMEFFFAPNGEDRYCNLEINANGCYVCRIGRSRRDRIDADLLYSHPRAVIGAEGWQIDAEISLAKLRALYGFAELQCLMGNFFKCGDETPFPHYGMWSPVASETPDFHRPECFGRLILLQKGGLTDGTE